MFVDGVELANGYIAEVADFACGTGGFLTSWLNELQINWQFGDEKGVAFVEYKPL